MPDVGRCGLRHHEGWLCHSVTPQQSAARPLSGPDQRDIVNSMCLVRHLSNKPLCPVEVW